MNEQEGMAALRSKTGTAAPSRSVVLPSGLRVLCRMMPDYSTVHAMYATAFGSVMRSFSLDGKKYNVPAGTAHFLEHKMFESEQGDAFELYAKTGPLQMLLRRTIRPAISSQQPRSLIKIWTFCSTWWEHPILQKKRLPRSRASSARKSRCTRTAPIGGCSMD